MDIIEISSSKQLKQFLDLPFEIHKNHTGWLPPIYSDDEVFFDRNKNNQNWILPVELQQKGFSQFTMASILP